LANGEYIPRSKRIKEFARAYHTSPHGDKKTALQSMVVSKLKHQYGIQPSKSIRYISRHPEILNTKTIDYSLIAKSIQNEKLKPNPIDVLAAEAKRTQKVMKARETYEPRGTKRWVVDSKTHEAHRVVPEYAPEYSQAFVNRLTEYGVDRYTAARWLYYMGRPGKKSINKKVKQEWEKVSKTMKEKIPPEKWKEVLEIANDYSISTRYYDPTRKNPSWTERAKLYEKGYKELSIPEIPEYKEQTGLFGVVGATTIDRLLSKLKSNERYMSLKRTISEINEFPGATLILEGNKEIPKEEFIKSYKEAIKSYKSMEEQLMKAKEKGYTDVFVSDDGKIFFGGSKSSESGEPIAIVPENQAAPADVVIRDMQRKMRKATANIDDSRIYFYNGKWIKGSELKKEIEKPYKDVIEQIEESGAVSIRHGAGDKYIFGFDSTGESTEPIVEEGKYTIDELLQKVKEKEQEVLSSLPEQEKYYIGGKWYTKDKTQEIIANPFKNIESLLKSWREEGITKVKYGSEGVESIIPEYNISSIPLIEGEWGVGNLGAVSNININLLNQIEEELKKEPSGLIRLKGQEGIFKKEDVLSSIEQMKQSASSLSSQMKQWYDEGIRKLDVEGTNIKPYIPSISVLNPQKIYEKMKETPEPFLRIEGFGEVPDTGIAYTDEEGNEVTWESYFKNLAEQGVKSMNIKGEGEQKTIEPVYPEVKIASVNEMLKNISDMSTQYVNISGLGLYNTEELKSKLSNWSSSGVEKLNVKEVEGNKVIEPYIPSINTTNIDEVIKKINETPEKIININGTEFNEDEIFGTLSEWSGKVNKFTIEKDEEGNVILKPFIPYISTTNVTGLLKTMEQTPESIINIKGVTFNESNIIPTLKDWQSKNITKVTFKKDEEGNISLEPFIPYTSSTNISGLLKTMKSTPESVISIGGNIFEENQLIPTFEEWKSKGISKIRIGEKGNIEPVYTPVKSQTVDTEVSYLPTGGDIKFGGLNFAGREILPLAHPGSEGKPLIPTIEFEGRQLMPGTLTSEGKSTGVLNLTPIGFEMESLPAGVYEKMFIEPEKAAIHSMMLNIQSAPKGSIFNVGGKEVGKTEALFSVAGIGQTITNLDNQFKKFSEEGLVLQSTSEGIKVMTPLQAFGEQFKQRWESATPEERIAIEKELYKKYYKPAEQPKLYGSLVLGGIAHTLTGYGKSKPARIEISEIGETIPITTFSKRYNVKRGIGFIMSEQPSHLSKEEAVGSIIAEEFLNSFYSPKIKQEYYKGLDIFGKATEVVGGSAASAMMFPITLPETVIEYTTKKDILPFTNFIQKEYVGYGENAIGGGYVGGLTGEAIERIRRRNLNLGWQSEAMKVAASHPIEAVGATAGELFGLWLGGKAVHVGKVATIKGLGKTRQVLQKTFDINLPGYTEIMYHMPHRYIRRWWVKRGTKNISDVMPIEFHSPETLTSGGLSFAKGETPLQRIRWTIEKTGETKQLKLSGKKYVLSASGSKRIGRTFMVKEKVLHELPAMSTTPYGYAPTRFYRFGPPRLEYSSSLTLFPRIKVPTGLVVRVKKIFQPPRGSYADVSTWAATQPKGSWGVIAPKMYMGGAEAEINIFGKTILKRFLPDTSNVTWLQRLKGYQYYTEVPLVGGKLTEYAPVVFTEPVHVGFPSGVRQILPKTGYTIRQIFSTSPSSELVSSTSLLNLNVLPLARISQPSVSRFQYPMYSILGLQPSIYTPLSDRYSSYNVPQYHPVDITSYTPGISSIPISTYDSMQNLYKSISTVYKYPYSLDRYKSNLYATSYTAPYIAPYYATPTAYYI